MKRREFIGEACKFAVLCTSPVLLTTLQSCEDNVDDSVTNDDFIDTVSYTHLTLQTILIV